MDWKYTLPTQCPPKEARNDEIELYRLVENSPPTSSDFVPLAVELKTPHQKFDEFMNCCSHGLSAFKTIEGAIKWRKKYKKKFKNHKISKGVIKKKDGMVLETFKRPHITWWVSTEQPERGFIEVEENAAA
ncbi:hypothetical protein [Nitrincola lacisaponensis]|uniref:hypothetical protein n=1 Tax=Nitrincola lacisaponensis TaxID=267850 RepID=UPI00056AF453|nr:hypothetical protein [Nitrincola lacisaponensis]